MKKNLFNVIFSVLTVGCLMFSSCVSSDMDSGSGENTGSAKTSSESKAKIRKLKDSEYLAALDGGEYDSCIDYLKKKNSDFFSPKNADSSKHSKDAIRDYYEIAMMNHFKKSYDDSEMLFDVTDKLIEESVTKSISMGVASAIGNDNAAAYVQSDYEYFLLPVFSALNYLGKGDRDRAIEVANDIAQKQNKYQVYADMKFALVQEDEKDNDSVATEKAYQTLKISPAKFEGSVPSKPTLEDKVTDSATARYLEIVFGKMGGTVNGLLDPQFHAKFLNELNSSIDTDAEINIPADKGRLDVIAFSGLVNRRGEQRTIIGPFPGLFIAGVAIPAFDIEIVSPAFPAPQTIPADLKVAASGMIGSYSLKPGKTEITKLPDNKIESVKLIVEGQSPVVLSLLEDFNYGVQHDVNLKARRAYMRSVRRSVTKKSTAVISASVAMFAAYQALEEAKKRDALIYAAGKTAYIASYFAQEKLIDQIDKSEFADIRQVYAIPQKASVAGVNLEPGKYSFKVQYLAKNGSVVAEESFSDIEVKAGLPTLVESSCLK